MTQPSARVLLYSLHPDKKHKLATFELSMHRFVLSEFNTHRMLCLAGDNMLEFDFPNAVPVSGTRRNYQMAIADFVRKWHEGVNLPTVFSIMDTDINNIQSEARYSPIEISKMYPELSIGILHRERRMKQLIMRKENQGWSILGSNFISWMEIRSKRSRQEVRLSRMNIRQLDEKTGIISTSTVKNCWVSGEKEIFEVKAGNYSVAGSKDHLIMTEIGYTRIEDLIPGISKIVVKSYGVQEIKDPNRLKKINGRWTIVFNKQLVKAHKDKGGVCQICGKDEDLEAHHVVPVSKDISLAFREDNILIICNECQIDQHRIGHTETHSYLYGGLATVDSVTSRGMEQTYDLEIEGPYPNFLANGVVVHNSRNSASSRAIPFDKMLDRVLADPAIPISWPEEKSGMQGGGQIDSKYIDVAIEYWLHARDDAVHRAKQLREADPHHKIHKSVINRLLEPFLWHTVIATGTIEAWNHFFDLRCSPLAQPEIRAVAEAAQVALLTATPQELDWKQPHLPLVTEIDEEEIEQAFQNSVFPSDFSDSSEVKCRISAARCARVSYLTHDQIRDWDADLRLFDRLENPGDGAMHSSPFEHVAFPAKPTTGIKGNFRPWWHQYRHIVEGRTYAQ